jgi:hypothetical protein
MNYLVTAGLKLFHHLLRIDKVLGATKGYYVYSLPVSW